MQITKKCVECGKTVGCFKQGRSYSCREECDKKCPQPVTVSALCREDIKKKADQEARRRHNEKRSLP